MCEPCIKEDVGMWLDLVEDGEMLCRTCASTIEDAKECAVALGFDQGSNNIIENNYK
jgi:hypothetical protein